MYFWANSRCRIENSVEKAAVFLHPMYIIGLKIVPRDDAVRLVYTEQKHKEFDAIIAYTWFGIILVEINPAGAFLPDGFFMGLVNMKNSNLGALFCQI